MAAIKPETVCQILPPIVPVAMSLLPLFFVEIHILNTLPIIGHIIIFDFQSININIFITIKQLMTQRLSVKII